MKVDDILIDILKRTTIQDWNKYSESFDIQGLYDIHRVYLINKYFDGNALRYGVKMASIFKPYTQDEIRAKELNRKVFLFKKYSLNKRDTESVKEYNMMVSELNRLVKPHQDLRKLYIKITKTKP